MRKNHDENWIERSFSKDETDICLAPAEGLLLNRISFDGYNKRQNIPAKIIFDEKTEKQMIKFKEEVIYNYIYNIEKIH